MEHINIYPHDLLKLNDFNAFKTPQLPDWALIKLKKYQTVVVTRNQINNKDFLSVGVRGFERNQRLGGIIAIKNIKEVITPYQLITDTYLTSLVNERIKLPVFKAIKYIKPILDKRVTWGIGGSAGYELATHDPMVKPTSDIDIILKMKCNQSLSYQMAINLLTRVNQFNVHVDIQVVYKYRGFSLEEYVQQRAKNILIKSEKGPFLSSNPWQDLFK